MRYITLHHGTFWFQIRVPAFARAHFGEVVRINLQTADRAVAKSLGLRLAAEWFTKFSQAAAVDVVAVPCADAWTPVLLPETPAQAMEARPGTSLGQAFVYWRDLVHGRPERTVMEFERTAELFDERIDKPLAALVRADIAAFRDSRLKDGLAWATVRKRLCFVSAMLQAQYDAGHLAANVARGLRVPRTHTRERSRVEFSTDQLRKIFDSPVYTRHLRPRGGGGEAAAWLPLLGLATGARLEELCQLRVSDVLHDPNHGTILRIDGDGLQTRLVSSPSR